MKKIILIVLLMVLLSSNVIALDAFLPNGTKIVVSDNFCSDSVNGVKVMGDSFFVFCEGIIYDKPYAEMDVLNLTEEEVNDEKQYVDIKTNETLIKKDVINFHLAFSIIGLILISILIVLIVAHFFKRKKDDRDAIRRLRPYISNLQKKGFSDESIENMLVQKGYDDSFINKLLNSK